MSRFVPSKRTVALAVAGAIAGTGALSLPAFANSTPRPRAASVQPLVLDFTTNVLPAGATSHGAVAAVKDTGGNTIGSAYTNCDRDDQTTQTHTAFCTGLLRITNGASAANGEISFSAVLPLNNQATLPEAGYFSGVVNGGTKAFEGITGETRFVLRSANSYDLTFG
ncbi:hypothetical protein ABTY61_23090 [Kitasatospora sp. NPDC096128]|uniref:hypothetical protein n=1 Tax=Kitasatospora sp. NPDC096128 TaxID=3155547 RepID=UPI0033291C76